MAKSDPLRLEGGSDEVRPVVEPSEHLLDELMEQVRELLLRTLAVDVRDVNEDLIEGAVLDSLALVELLFELERRFDVVLDVSVLNIESFRSVAQIAQFVAAQRLGAPS